MRASPAGAAPVPPGPAFAWRGSSAWRCRNFGKSAQLFLCVSPQGSREGRSILARSPEHPAGFCHQRPHCATASWLVPPGLALALLCAGSWRLWVRVSNFKGMSYFLEKMDRLSKKQITPTREGSLIGASLWTLTRPPGAGPGALHCRDRGKRSGPGCCGDTLGRKLQLRPLCLPVGRANARRHPAAPVLAI